MQLDAHLLGGAGDPAVFVRWVAPEAPRAGVVFLHGSMVHSEYYLPLAVGLAERGFCCWLPDLSGHGRSDGERGHLRAVDQHVTDVLRVVEAEVPAHAPWILGGESYGAVVAALAFHHLPSHRRPGGLVLVSPAVRLRVSMAPWARGLVRAAAELWPRLRPPIPAGLRGVTAHPDIEELVRRDPLLCRRYSLGFFAALLEAQDRLAQLEPPAAPTLMLVPESDVVVDHEETLRLATRWPDCRAEVLAGGLHALCVDRSREVAERIAGWFLAAPKDFRPQCSPA
ncbi:MAG: lysophospholipase [Firmicutes bacterium]|nr:alpha/beta fold hydrolase [Alicyclobacillaceae bacterium]MCL6496033.1 lysophospholipase [Bacillota bacterium]